MSIPVFGRQSREELASPRASSRRPGVAGVAQRRVSSRWTPKPCVARHADARAAPALQWRSSTWKVGVTLLAAQPGAREGDGERTESWAAGRTRRRPLRHIGRVGGRVHWHRHRHSNPHAQSRLDSRFSVRIYRQSSRKTKIAIDRFFFVFCNPRNRSSAENDTVADMMTQGRHWGKMGTWAKVDGLVSNSRS